MSVRLVLLSDTHNRCEGMEVPDGDLLLHAGDLTGRGTLPEIERANAWLASLPHPRKVVVAGNHDFAFERAPAEARARLDAATYLEDGETEVGGLRIWGSPWQPRFRDWAFNLPRGPALAAVWARIPEGIDVLLVHGPPAGVLDRTASGAAVGCRELRAAVERVRPRLCVFGHIHEGYGTLRADGTLFVNASNCDVAYRPVNPPQVVEL